MRRRIVGKEMWIREREKTDKYGLEIVAIKKGVEEETMEKINAGDTGSNGSVLVGLERAEDALNIWLSPADFTVSENVFSLLITGGHYVNVHTPANPSGELRGQIQ